MLMTAGHAPSRVLMKVGHGLGERGRSRSMNLMEVDRPFVRQRNEELLREVRRQRLEKRLRAKAAVGEYEPREGKGVRLGVRRTASVLAVVTATATAIFSAPAFASHQHYLLTPGTCVEVVASGQTSKGEGEGGYHKFHDNVHKGQPGTAAFENPNNPVGVDKGSCPDY
jgi:hypothetical protein